MIAAACGGVRVVCLYAPNGRVVGSPFYEAKLAWFDRLARWLGEAADPARRRSCSAATSTSRPTDADVWDPRGLPRRHPRLAAGARGLRAALPLGARRRLPPAPPRARPLHLVGLPRRQLPQELRHAHRPPAGHARRSPSASCGRRSTARRARASRSPPTTRRWSSTSTSPGTRSTPAGPRPRSASPRAAAPLMAAATASRSSRPSSRCSRSSPTELPEGDGLALRAEVGRLPRHRVPRRRPALHPEPRPEAARPLLPRAGGDPPGEPARALRGRRRDRDRRPSTASTSTRCSCASTRRPRAWPSSRPRRRRRSSPSTCWPRATTTCAPRPQAERRRAAGAGARRAPRGRVHLTPVQPRPRGGRRTGSTASRAPGSTA